MSLVPPPIVFDLDAAENVRIRRSLLRANGLNLMIPVYVANVLLAVGLGILKIYRHESLGWLWLAIAVGYIAAFVPLLTARWNWQTLITAPQVATSIVFHETGIEIERGRTPAKRAKRFVPFAQIRSVQLTADALVISKRWFVFATVPRGAIADGGEQLMRFFEDHLVAKRGLRRSLSSATIIINTIS